METGTPDEFASPGRADEWSAPRETDRCPREDLAPATCQASEFKKSATAITVSVMTRGPKELQEDEFPTA